MVENDRGGTEYFLENDIECNNININGSSNNNIINNDDLVDDDEINEVSRKSDSSSTSMFSQQWPRSFREATDSYTIAFSPNFGLITRSSFFRQSTHSISATTIFDNDYKTPLMGENEDIYKKEDSDRISRSSWLEKSSLREGSVEEPPVSQGCSFIQTVFNGVNVLAGVGLLSTPLR
ncbi:hypothetical protein POM88_041562 [Heracleum sosnowskyi]|uniref:Amino acid transporter transmembrane domain-containing protein n=1 Tax=Heracleum sosnowskyi TaxID=360622 RepID=A0AAD8M9U3_9APIA|nr:hypothetical protein POM88_041562 [Heracleum sosnowskyi]